MTLQIYLNTLRPRISFKRAAELLRGPEPAFVAVNKLAPLEAARSAGDPPLYCLLPDPGNPGKSPTRIISNRPALAPTDSAAFCFGALSFRVHGARLLQATEREFRFSVTGQAAEVIVSNESPEPRKVRLCAAGQGKHRFQERVLASQEVWQAALVP